MPKASLLKISQPETPLHAPARQGFPRWVTPPHALLVTAMYLISSYLRRWPRPCWCRRCRRQRMIGTGCRAREGWRLLGRWWCLCDAERTRVTRWTQEMWARGLLRSSIYLSGVLHSREILSPNSYYLSTPSSRLILMLMNVDVITSTIYWPLCARACP